MAQSTSSPPACPADPPRRGPDLFQSSPESVTVFIPGALLSRTGGRTRLSVRGTTVREMIDALERDYPGLRFNLCHETGELRPFVNVFVDSEEVRWLQGLETPLRPGTTVHIIHSVAGG